MTTLTKKDEAESVGPSGGRPHFTPGPWHVDYDIQTGKRIVRLMEGRGRSVAHVLANFKIDENNANAELIAAAPELYEALRRLVAHVQAHLENPAGQSVGGVADALAAIAKAVAPPSEAPMESDRGYVCARHERFVNPGEECPHCEPIMIKAEGALARAVPDPAQVIFAPDPRTHCLTSLWARFGTPDLYGCRCGWRGERIAAIAHVETGNATPKGAP